MVSKSAELLANNALLSGDDAWLVGQGIVSLRNPYCVGNADVAMQLAFWLKVSVWVALYALVVGVSSLAWVRFWLHLKSTGAMSAIMPCKCSSCMNPETVIGKDSVMWCPDAVDAPDNAEFSTADDNCKSLGFMYDQCIPDPCINSSDDLADCWYVTAFALVTLTAYFFLLHRRNSSGRTLLCLTCVVEGVLCGAGTLAWDTVVFLDFFVYHFFMVVCVAISIAVCRHRWHAALGELKNAKGYTGSKTPEAQKAVSKLLTMVLFGSLFIVTVVSFLYYIIGNGFIAIGQRGIAAAIFFPLLLLVVTAIWIMFESHRLQNQFSPDEPLHFVISLHVDMFCVVFFTLLFIFIFIGIAVWTTGGAAQQTMMGKCYRTKRPSVAQDMEEEEEYEEISSGAPSGAIIGANVDSPTKAARRQSLECSDEQASKNSTGASPSSRTSFVKKEKNVKDERKKKLVNLAGVVWIAGLTTLCFFDPKAASSLAIVSTLLIPISRIFIEKATVGRRAREQLAGEWVDRAGHVHTIDEEGWVTLHGLGEDEGARYIFVHTGSIVTLRTSYLPMLRGYVKWSDDENPMLLSVTWQNGDQWTRKK